MEHGLLNNHVPGRGYVKALGRFWLSVRDRLEQQHGYGVRRRSKPCEMPCRRAFVCVGVFELEEKVVVVEVEVVVSIALGWVGLRLPACVRCGALLRYSDAMLTGPWDAGCLCTR